jgi:HK97 family phage major capsid protein
METSRLADLNQAEFQRLQTADLMRALSAKAFGGVRPGDYFAEHWPTSVNREVVTRYFEKAAVTANSTTDSAALMAPGLVRGFVPLVKAASVLGKLPLTAAPFNVTIARQTAGSSTAWVGENMPKPASKLGFGAVTLPWSKAVSFVVVSKELLRLDKPGSVEQLQQTLRDEMVAFTDKEFLSSTAATPTVRPAGILAGVTPVTPTASLGADLATLVNTFFTNRPYAVAPYVVCSPAVAAKIAAVQNLGRDITVEGGRLLGLPVVTTPAAGANAIVLDAPVIFLADGGIGLDTSEEAMLEMVDVPTSPPVAATVYQSIWGTDQIAIRCERFVSWVVVASNAVQYLVVA